MLRRRTDLRRTFRKAPRPPAKPLAPPPPRVTLPKHKLPAGWTLAILAAPVAVSWWLFTAPSSSAALPPPPPSTLCGQPNPAPSWTAVPIPGHRRPWYQATEVDVPPCAEIQWLEDGVEMEGRQFGTPRYDDAISISNRYRVRSTGPKGRIVHYRLLEQPNAGKTPVPIDVAAK
ncbi:MAG: hypothetical protein JO348_00455 [Alphaproteobacteria bacterium]|nr:hypothetical protein [Alphaproteobacteria bacterium]